MHELLGDGAAAAPCTVRVVRGGEVAAVRRSSPDSAIVALIRSTDPRAAVAARLAGADVVLPCIDENAPEPDALATARAAAALLAGRDRQIRDRTRDAAHEVAGQASSLALVAQLLGPQEPPQRAAQLRELAARGRALAWRADRPHRARGVAVELIDLTATVRSLVPDGAGPDERAGHAESATNVGRAERAGTAGPDDPRGRPDHGGHGPVIRVETPPAPARVLVDPGRLAAALAELTGNAVRAGARTVTVRLGPGPAGNRAGVEIAVEDDGAGLPAGWMPDLVGQPFVGGRPGSAGLGLAEVAEFAADHGGTLTIGPRPAGPGTRAVLRFPAPPGPGVPALRPALRPALLAPLSPP